MDEKLHPRETFPRQQAAPTSKKAHAALVCISDVMGNSVGRAGIIKVMGRRASLVCLEGSLYDGQECG